MLDLWTSQVWMKDAEGRFLYANDALRKIAEFGNEDIIGRTLFELAPTDAALELDKTDRSIMQSGLTSKTKQTMMINGVTNIFIVNKISTTLSEKNT